MMDHLTFLLAFFTFKVNVPPAVMLAFFLDNFAFVFFAIFLSIVYRRAEKNSAVSFFRRVFFSFLFHAESRTTRLTGMVVTFGTISPFLLRSIYAMESSDISSIG